MHSAKDENLPNDRRLDKLLRICLDSNDSNFERPSPAAIEAYLLGKATAAQKQEVRAALIQSASFRRELLRLAEELASLSEAQTAEEFEKAETPESPSLDSFLETAGQKRTSEQSWWSQVRHVLRVPTVLKSGPLPRAVAVGLICVILVAIVSVRIGEEGGQLGGLPALAWSQVSTLDAGLFVSNLPRSPRSADDQPLTYETANLAAQAEFMRVVSYDEQGYNLDTAISQASPSRPSRPVLLHLVDDCGVALREFEAFLAPPEGQESATVEAWLLAIPSRQVFSAVMVCDSVAATWGVERDRRGCVVFVYQLDSTYAASVGQAFDLEAHR